jgi:hypothetical protein
VGLFRTSKNIPIVLSDLSPVASDVVQHFQRQGYVTTSQRAITGRFDITVSKGGIFAAIIGTKRALKIEIVNIGTCTEAKAGVGIFGQHAVALVIALLFDSLLWPLIVAQIFGLVRQSQLDDEAVTCIEESLKVHKVTLSAAPAVIAGGPRFCVECGAANASDSIMCTHCGTKLVA